ncbi:MAG: sulfatase-like hydrolase/transferase [Polyangiales bacterium]
MSAEAAAVRAPDPSTSRLREVAASGFAGFLAGLFTGLGDYGASWLWLPLWSDRLSFLGRVLALEAPLGGLLGAALGAFHAFVVGPLLDKVAARSSRPSRARDLLFPIAYVGLLAPALRLVSVLLFTGGKMQRLAHKGALSVTAFVVLLVGSYVALLLGRKLVSAAERRGSRARDLLALALLAVAFLGGKANQHVLPNLYEYLHASLALASFALAYLGSALLVDRARERPALEARLVQAAVATATLAAIGLLANLGTLEANQNVRVALLDPKAPHARTVVRGLAPLLRRLEGRRYELTPEQRARAARLRRRTAWTGPPLPQTPGAHVLLVTIDALRADHLGTYGYGRGLSPNLDAFAREGVVFERAYAAAPHSSYSLCSLQTSEYIHEVVDLRLPLPEETMASVLGDVGYHTAAFYTLGIFHTEGERLRPYEEGVFAFQRHEHTNFRAEERVDKALEEYDRILERGEPPSFVWTHFFDVHEPYLDTSLGSADMDRYDAEIRNVDRAFARLIRETKKRIHRPLVVVVTADHGEEFHDHGGVYHGSTLYEEQTRVPLIVHAPGLAGRRVAEPVELVDVAPTILGLVGLGTATTMRGDDLRPYAMGYARRTAPAFSAVAHKRMIVEWPYKLVADLRFDVYELYDLSHDARERRNLASQQAGRLDAMRAGIYAWLDGIKSSAAGGRSDPRVLALDWGRLGDRRAVEPLSTLLVDEQAPTDRRTEAARLLGRLADPRAKPALVRALSSRDSMVAAESAIALGRMYDRRGLRALRGLVRSEDPSIRIRSGISLARLEDRAAVPALLETLRVSQDQFEREEAVRWLGRLRDPVAVDPLIELLPDYRIRHMTVVALGRLRDPRAFEPLMAMLGWEHHSHIRNNLTQALGEFGDPRAIPALITIAARESDLSSPSESLVRLGAIGRGAIGGIDFDRASTRGVAGIGECQEGDLDYEWSYVGRTTCKTMTSEVRVPLSIPPQLARARGEVVVLLRAKSGVANQPGHATLTIGRRRFGPIALDGTLREYRFVLPSAELRSGHVEAVITMGSASDVAELDHLLLLAVQADG